MQFSPLSNTMVYGSNHTSAKVLDSLEIFAKSLKAIIIVRGILGSHMDQLQNLPFPFS